MSRRSIIKSADWVLTVGGGEGAPGAIFSVECMTCHQASAPVDDDRVAAESWALKHTLMNPMHRLFKLLTESYWRTGPASEE